MYPHSIPSTVTCDPPSPSLTDFRRKAEARALVAELDAEPVLAPPSAKRGAQTTNDANAGVHWVALSHRDESGEPFCDLLHAPRSEWRDGERGMKHYPRCLFLGSVRVGYGGDPHNGSHMEMSGRACEEIEAMSWFTTWADFFAGALAMGFKPSRIDAYKDCRDGSVTPADVHRKWRAGEATSRAKNGHPWEDVPLGCGDDNDGEMFCIGRRGSGTYLRVYDKAKEQAPKDDARAEWLRQCGPWVRVEAELRDERAELFMQDVAANGFGPQTIGRMINAHTMFKDGPAVGKNGYRVGAWEPWLKLMQTAEKLRRNVEKGAVSMEAIEYRFFRQQGPTLAALFAYYEGDMVRLKKMVKPHFARMNRRLMEALDFDGWCDKVEQEVA